MAFPARYSSKCSKCGGDMVAHLSIITWNRSKHTKKAWHYPDCQHPWDIHSEEWKRYITDRNNRSTSTPASTSTPDDSTPKDNGSSTPKNEGNGNLGETLASAIAPYLENKLASKVDEGKVREIVEQAISDSIIPLTIEVKLPNGDTTRIEQAHSMFPTILDIVRCDIPVYMYSHLPGTGKSTIAEQCAIALDLPFFTETFSPATPEWRIFGFANANGGYVESNFYRAYTQGGLFFVDEYDNGSASLVTTLNQAISNGHTSFPVHGVCKRHENFRFLCSGNTPARGANPRFPDRRPQDGASLDRLVYIDLPVDESLEQNLALAYTPDASKWVKWVQAVRSTSTSKYPKLIASPRASINGAKLLAHTPLGMDKLADMLIFKGLDDSTKQAILADAPLPR